LLKVHFIWVYFFVQSISFFFQSSIANQSLDHLLNCFDKILTAPVKNPPSKSKASRSKDQQKGASEGKLKLEFKTLNVSAVKSLFKLTLVSKP